MTRNQDSTDGPAFVCHDKDDDSSSQFPANYLLTIIYFNSLTPCGFDYILKFVNFKLISTINIFSIFCEIAIRWMPQHLTDHLSTLGKVMACCRPATSHYLSQCWPRSCRHMTSQGHNELTWILTESTIFSSPIPMYSVHSQLAQS